jgi:hypothetical protein
VKLKIAQCYVSVHNDISIHNNISQRIFCPHSVTFKVARYVVFNDAIRVDRTDTNDNDINNNYNMIKAKCTQESVG